MSDTVDRAAAAATLELMDSNAALFTLRDQPKTPCAVTLPGSGNFNLMPFNVTATGTAKAHVPGTVFLTLYGRAKLDDATADPNQWLPLSSTPSEPIGGVTDLAEAMFLLRAADLLANTETGKIQGTFQSNVASTPVAAQDLEQHPGDVTAEDPLYVFAIGASFTPTSSKIGKPRAVAEGEPLCSLTLASLTLSA